MLGRTNDGVFDSRDMMYVKLSSVRRTQACLRKAEEWEHSAQRTSDESARLLYLDLAKQWRDVGGTNGNDGPLERALADLLTDEGGPQGS